jgi:hypothetical protein
MKKTFKMALLVLFLPVLLCIYHAYFYVPVGEGIWESTSPDGQFEVVGHGKMSLRKFLPTMPGSGGDVDGVIVLRDKKTGTVLQKQNVDLVNLVGEESVTWIKGNMGKVEEVVIIGVDIIWQLPPTTH